MLFVKSQSHTYSVHIPEAIVEKKNILEFLEDFIVEKDGIPRELQIWNAPTFDCTEDYIMDHFNDTFPASLSVTIACAGGKGGFGSMLRAEGKKNLGKKTTNFESSRDLSGRRIRTVNEAKKLADYIAQAPERAKAEREALEEKLKLEKKKLEAKDNAAVKVVDNSAFLKEKEKVLETMDEAIDSALKKATTSSFKVAKAAVKKAPGKKASAWKNDSDSD